MTSLKKGYQNTKHFFFLFPPFTFSQTLPTNSLAQHSQKLVPTKAPNSNQTTKKMPIYYKKVNHDAAELGLIESGLGTTTTSSSSTTNGHQNSSPTSNGSSFLSGVQKKLASASGFGGSRSSLFGVGSNGSEVELERISSSFHVESEDHLDDLHLGNGSSPSNSKRAPFLLKSKATNEDRDRLMTKYGPIVVVKQLPPPPMNSSSSNPTEPIQVR